MYAIGDWWTIPGDLGSLRYSWKGGNEIYEPAAARPILRRGQRPHPGAGDSTGTVTTGLSS